jgi:hypothetical protein
MSEIKTRRIRITHDGGLSVAHSTKVLDAETGELIKWVSRVELVFDAREGIQAIIYVIPETDIVVDAEVRPYHIGENAK